MGLFDKLNPFADGDFDKEIFDEKFIDLKLISYWGIKTKENQIQKIAVEMGEILLNTQAFFSDAPKNGLYSRKNFMGCTNSILGINSLLVKDMPKFHSSISRVFVPFSDDKNNQWVVRLVPVDPKGVSFYSLPELYNDMFVLATANIWIKEKFEIKVNFSTYDTIFVDKNLDVVDKDGSPALIYKEPLMNQTYTVWSRIQAEKTSPNLSKTFFGESIYKTLDRILNDIDNGIGNSNSTQWAIQVRKILEQVK